MALLRLRRPRHAAANLYSLIASCKLHRLDPERYLAEMIRIIPTGRAIVISISLPPIGRKLEPVSTRSNSRLSWGSSPCRRSSWTRPAVVVELKSRVLSPSDYRVSRRSLQERAPRSGYVFTTSAGRMTTRTGGRIIEQAAIDANIKKAVSPHWLRHCCASHSLDRGAPIHIVQASLGHATVTTTGRYLHARPGDGAAKFLAVYSGDEVENPFE